MGRKLTLIEAAEWLMVKPKTVYNWIWEGRIPHYKQGGRLLFDEDELAAWREGFHVRVAAQHRGVGLPC